MKWLLVFLVTFKLYAQSIDIIADWPIEVEPTKFTKIKQEYELRCIHANEYLQHYSEDVKKIVVYNPYMSLEHLAQLPKQKLVLYMFEPMFPINEYYEYFSKVYTWNDDLIDGVKFHKLDYPYLTSMEKNLPSFSEKKFCTLIASRWTKERLEALRFFDKKPRGEFEFWGRYAPWEFAANPMYRGSIPGFHTGSEKISTLKNYRFCMCFENTIGLNGYVTEKIFGCFAAGCIPIYWGAANIGKYIPKGCYIDFRDFSNYEELYQMLKEMPEGVYEGYLNRIRAFLKSKRSERFSVQAFEEKFERAINE